VAKYLYDSFGNTLGMWGQLAAGNTYRFSSKEQDVRSGLYYYGYRWYDANLQRWVNRDPIGERGGINLYGFVGNNPINKIDYFGLAYGNPISGPSGPVGPSDPYSFGGGYYPSGYLYVPAPKVPDAQIFVFGGGEAKLPAGQGGWESATFGGYDNTHGYYLGGLHCALTNKKFGFLVSGAGYEGGFSSKTGTYTSAVGMTELDIGVGGVGYIFDDNGQGGVFIYVETPGGSRVRGAGFVGVGFDFDMIH
jgi:RHS repeat-associated protein